MSHIALRRVMIRLLHDPALVEAVQADPGRALRDAGLSPVELAWLRAAPRAAWGTDPARPGRVLAALLEEYPATSFLAPDQPASFFASTHFHRAVQQRGSLALALGEHLAETRDSRARQVARVEASIARVRRAARRVAPSPAGCLRLAPHAGLLTVRERTLEALAAARRREAPPDLGKGKEHVLVLRAAPGGDVTAEAIPAALADLLAQAVAGAPREALLARARDLGAAPGEDEEILRGLARDGILL
jgi:hypothetical protein